MRKLSQFFGKHFHILLSIAVLCAAIGLRIVEPPVVLHAQMAAFDTFQRLSPRPFEPAGAKIVDIDEESLARLGQWPWPRTVVAQLVGRLQQAGAAAIAFDVVFAEADRTSPTRILPLWGAERNPELRRLAGTLPDHDATLAAQIGQGAVVTGFVLTEEANELRPQAKAGISFTGDDPLAYLPKSFHGTIPTLPQLTEAAAGNGSFNFYGVDPSTGVSSGIIRKVPLVMRLGDQIYPSLAVEALRVAQQAGSVLIKSSGASGEIGGQTGIISVKVGEVSAATDTFGQMWLWDSGHRAERYVPAWKVLSEQFDPSEVEGQIVFVGTSARGLLDLRSTPLDPVVPGVELHAQAVEQMVLGQSLQRPDWTVGAELLYILLLGLALIALIEWLGSVWAALIGSLFLAGAVGASWIAYAQLQWLLDPVFPIVALLMVYLTASALHFLKSESERRFVRGAFSRYLSPALVEQLADSKDGLTLGGEMRNMTLLFCDVRGFTTISEQFDPQGLTHLINSFLTPMTGIILQTRGTIDKYIGDCIMAFWNAPLDDAEHARHGCIAALRMIEHMPVLNDQLRAEAEAAGRKHIPLAIGIGLNSGDACVGNMGSDQRFDYSVLGDTVNLASRLEGQSKPYGVAIVISDETYRQAPELAALELDLIRVKGKTQPVRIFTLVGDAEVAATDGFRAWRAAHNRMIAAYRTQDWTAARTALGEARRISDQAIPGFYALYEERIAEYEAQSPGEAWDGVFTATSK